MGNFKILLAPNRELAETIQAVASVEAEYGDFCVKGEKVTLAHHGSRSCNPAPCNTPNVPVLDGGTILVSHLDLDTEGGLLALMGEKSDGEDADFWEGAEMIDVNGIHHINELSSEVQKKLNAFYAWKEGAIPRIRYTEITDLTDQVYAMKDALKKILNTEDPEHEKMIQAGIEWEREATAKVESKLVKETDKVRCFITDGVFCAAGYYSMNLKKIIPATVSCNTTYRSITVAFADGGKNHNACEIVQSLWGPAAGGRSGIGGSPRNWEISLEELKKEFEKCCKLVEEL